MVSRRRGMNGGDSEARSETGRKRGKRVPALTVTLLSPRMQLSGACATEDSSESCSCCRPGVYCQ